jgi:hypothetical protein
MSPKLEKVKNHPGIYRRGSRYVVTWRERSGKQRRQSAGTLAEARDLKAKNRNQRGPTRRIRFAAYAPLWLAGYRGRTGEGIGAGTLADYARSLEQDAVDYFGRLFLDEITTGEVKRYVSYLEKRGLAPRQCRQGADGRPTRVRERRRGRRLRPTLEPRPRGARRPASGRRRGRAGQGAGVRCARTSAR